MFACNNTSLGHFIVSVCKHKHVVMLQVPGDGADGRQPVSGDTNGPRP